MERNLFYTPKVNDISFEIPEKVISLMVNELNALRYSYPKITLLIELMYNYIDNRYSKYEYYL